jgi:hypothetical protein
MLAVYVGVVENLVQDAMVFLSVAKSLICAGCAILLSHNATFVLSFRPACKVLSWMPVAHVFL